MKRLSVSSDGRRQPAAYESLDALAHDLGRATAAEGLDLDAAIDRLRLVGRTVAGRRRRRFDVAELAVALTNGWVAGVLDREIDVSVEVLRSDAREQYRRCELLGLDPAQEIALVVFRPLVADRSDGTHAAVAVLQTLARRAFSSGESVALAHDKVLVLVHRGPELATHVHTTAAEMSEAVRHLGLSATYWIEPLCSDPRWLDEHLDALLV